MLFLPLSVVDADTFGSGANEFTIDFTTIGNAGNAADNTGYGAVGYGYRIGTYEVSRDMITKYNAIGGGPSISLQDMTNYGGNGPDKPATGVTWSEAARFVNWLNTSKGYSPAYKFTIDDNANVNNDLWTSDDEGYNPSNPLRNTNAIYVLPSEDEWYKAAFYDPNANGGTGGYWEYATGSDSAPTAVASGTTSGTAVYQLALETGPANITNAGGLSPYGTMAQNGNAWEWAESSFTAPNEDGTDSRVLRNGGWFDSTSANLASSFRLEHLSFRSLIAGGFRVAAVPVVAAVPELSGSFATLLCVLVCVEACVCVYVCVCCCV